MTNDNCVWVNVHYLPVREMGSILPRLREVVVPYSLSTVGDRRRSIGLRKSISRLGKCRVVFLHIHRMNGTTCCGKLGTYYPRSRLNREPDWIYISFVLTNLDKTVVRVVRVKLEDFSSPSYLTIDRSTNPECMWYREWFTSSKYCSILVHSFKFSFLSLKSLM